MLNSCIFTFCNTLSWFIPLVSWNSIKGTKCFSSLPEKKPGLGWFPFCCSCNIVTVIILQVPRWDNFVKRKVKYLLLAWIFYKYLSDFSSQTKVKNFPAYHLSFLTFSAFRDQYAASLCHSDIFFIASLHYSVCSVITQNRKLWKRQTY